MRKTILRRREQESFEIPPLPVRPSGQDLRSGLARFGLAVKRRTLKPGERVINGRVYYSAAWLDAHDLSHLADTKEEKMQHEVTIRFTTVDDIDDAELIARELAEHVSDAVHESHVLIGPRGLAVKVVPHGWTAHVDVKEAA